MVAEGLMPDEIIANIAGAGEIKADDILFECGNCGKSLVIDRRGAGLIIRCPDCNAELQVPIPAGVDLAEIDQSISADMSGAEDASPDILNLGDLPPDLQEKVRHLAMENQELHARRAHLERLHAKTAPGIQAVKRQLTVIRAALDQIEESLANMAEDSAAETQVVS